MIIGKIAESTEDGLRVSLNFFDDVQIPPTMMQDPSVFVPSTNRRNDQKQGTWVWKYGTDPENGPEGTSNSGEGEVESRFVMEVGDEVSVSDSVHFSLDYYLIE